MWNARSSKPARGGGCAVRRMWCARLFERRVWGGFKPFPSFRFVSSEVETPIGSARPHGVSTSLDTNGIDRAACPLPIAFCRPQVRISRRDPPTRDTKARHRPRHIVEERRLGAREPRLTALPGKPVVERGAAQRIEMRGDLVQDRKSTRLNSSH